MNLFKQLLTPLAPPPAFRMRYAPRPLPQKTDYTVFDIREEEHRQRKADRKNGPFLCFRAPHSTRVRRA